MLYLLVGRNVIEERSCEVAPSTDDCRSVLMFNILCFSAI